jgi:predicted metal-binding protein
MLRQRTVRPIPARVDEAALETDLERYRQVALDAGASGVEVVPANWVTVDERVRLKCQVPLCHQYGRCSNCPPYLPDLDFVRQALNRFKRAVLLKREVAPVEDFADSTRVGREGRAHTLKVDEIVARIEATAFADGYYLAMGFGSGSCRVSWCDSLLCQMLDSGMCRFAMKARPSMEAMGIDVFALVTRVGWEVYPVFKGMDAGSVPCALCVGIVFVS